MKSLDSVLRCDVDRYAKTKDVAGYSTDRAVSSSLRSSADAANNCEIRSECQPPQ